MSITFKKLPSGAEVWIIDGKRHLVSAKTVAVIEGAVEKFDSTLRSLADK